MATEAAWLNGNNWEKEEINEAEKEKKRKDERKVLTSPAFMEGLDRKDLLINILKNLGAV